MINIDGSSGGGQILRTCLGLSALTNKPFKIINIRGQRKEGGLKVQHLESINAVKKICNGQVENAFLGSKNITFRPGKIEPKKISIKITTAGSIGLVLQAALIPAIKEKIFLNIKGGATYGKWAPPIDSLQNIIFPLYKKMGYDVKITELMHGFYPMGQAKVNVVSEKANLKPIKIIEKGKLKKIQGISIASEFLKNKKVAERQTQKAQDLLFEHLNIEPEIETRYIKSACPGSGLTIWATTENSILGSDSIGELRKPAEKVAEEACHSLIRDYKKGAIDIYAADQLMPYMGLIGNSEIKTSSISEHIETNAKTIEKFLEIKFKLKKNIIKVS